MDTQDWITLGSVVVAALAIAKDIFGTWRQTNVQIRLARDQRRHELLKEAYTPLLIELMRTAKWASQQFLRWTDTGEWRDLSIPITDEPEIPEAAEALWSPKVQKLVSQWRKARAALQAAAEQLRIVDRRPIGAGDPPDDGTPHPGQERLSLLVQELKVIDARIQDQVRLELLGPPESWCK